MPSAFYILESGPPAGAGFRFANGFLWSLDIFRGLFRGIFACQKRGLVPFPGIDRVFFVVECEQKPILEIIIFGKFL